MSLAAANGYITQFSQSIGSSEAGVRLILSIFASYPLALIYRKFYYGRPINTQHIYFIFSGFLLGYFNYGSTIVHCFLAMVFSYAVLLLLGGTAIAVGIVFIFNMIYLLIGYYESGTENYDINWTMPFCVLVLRQIATAFDFFDGQQNPDYLGAENRKVAIKELPTFLEYLGHMTFPGSFMVGPHFSIKRYQQFVRGGFNGDNNKLNPGSEIASLKRFGLGVVYLSIHQLLGFWVSDDYLLSQDFNNISFLRKMFVMGLWGRFTLYKYISCWLLTEGACILFGVAYNGKDDSGNIQWNGVENVKLAIFENTTEFNHYIMSFNTNTNHWVAQYVYKRLKFLGNRHISQFSALLFLAIWHGLHSGYYVCFLLEFLVIYAERDTKYIVKSNSSLQGFFEKPLVQKILHVVLRIYTFVFMGFCLFPFALLQFDKYWEAFKSVYFICWLIFGLWPVLHGPLLKFLLVRKTPHRE